MRYQAPVQQVQAILVDRGIIVALTVRGTLQYGAQAAQELLLAAARRVDLQDPLMIEAGNAVRRYSRIASLASRWTGNRKVVPCPTAPTRSVPRSAGRMPGRADR